MHVSFVKLCVRYVYPAGGIQYAKSSITTFTWFIPEYKSEQFDCDTQGPLEQLKPAVSNFADSVSQEASSTCIAKLFPVSR